MNKHKQAFTLVELIVVITVLAILGTIAFISFSGYSKDARDSSRISDIKNISKTLDLYALQEGNYPTPDSAEQVTYSGAEIWSQGIFGEDTRKTVSSKAVISKVPTDPLTNSYYTYSLLNTKQEYQIGGIIEGSLSYNKRINSTLLSKTNAVNQKVTAYIKGNYNGKVAKMSTGSTNYILAVPSIINGDMSVKDYTSILNQKKLIYHGYKNIPSSFNGTTYTQVGETDLTLVNTGNIVVYTGDISSLSNSTNLQTFASNLKSAYSGTTISGVGDIKDIVSIDISFTESIAAVAGCIVDYTLGGKDSYGTNVCKNTNNSLASYGNEIVLLLHMDDVNIKDSSIYNNQINYDTTTQSLIEKKFGNSSRYFDGTSSFSIINTQNFNFQTDDFTIDYWVKFVSNTILDTTFYTSTGNTSSGDNFNFNYYSPQSSINYYIMGYYCGSQYNNWYPNMGEWYHVAGIREGNVFSIYINGNKINGCNTVLSIGNKKEFVVGHRGFNGYIDELRIVKGEAKWSNDFILNTNAY